MKITIEMVEELNNVLRVLDSVFRLSFHEDKYTYGNPTVEIEPANKIYLDSAIINPSKEFYIMIERYFAEKGITLKYNNTKHAMWSVDGYDKER